MGISGHIIIISYLYFYLQKLMTCSFRRFLHELCQVLEEEEPPLTGAVDVRQSPDSALHAGMNHFSLVCYIQSFT